MGKKKEWLETIRRGKRSERRESREEKECSVERKREGERESMEKGRDSVAVTSTHRKNMFQFQKRS